MGKEIVPYTLSAVGAVVILEAVLFLVEKSLVSVQIAGCLRNADPMLSTNLTASSLDSQLNFLRCIHALQFQKEHPIDVHETSSRPDVTLPDLSRRRFVAVLCWKVDILLQRLSRKLS